MNGIPHPAYQNSELPAWPATVNMGSISIYIGCLVPVVIHTY